MAELARQTKTNLNITSAAEVISYTQLGTATREVIARIDLGDALKPIAGGGIYLITVYIDNVLVVPVSDVIVPSGTTRAIVGSRVIPLDGGDVLSIRVQGLAGDTQVNTVASIRDYSALTVGEVVGDGAVMVDHDHGGTDNLAYKDSEGAGIDNAEVRVYLTEDYDAGNRSNAFIVARTTTVVGGRWAKALMLDPEDYTVVFFKQGVCGPDTAEITVTV